MSDEEAKVRISGDNADLIAKMHQSTKVVKDATAGMTKEFERVGAVIKNLQAPFLALGAILAGGALFEKVIESTAQFGSQLEVLSQKTGIEAEELSRLEYAANLSHVAHESLDVGLKKLARSMQDAAAGGITPAAQAFHAMGISVADSAGRLRPMEDVLLDVAAKFATYEDGAAKSALAMNLFGRSGQDLVPLLNKGREGIEQLRAESDRLGFTMSNQSVETAVQYENAMKRVHAATDGLGRQLATALMPALTSLADAFTQGATDGTTMQAVMELLAGTARFLGTVVIVVKGVVQEAWESFRIVFEGLATLIAGVGMAFVALQKGEWSGSVAIMKDTFADMADNVRQSNKRMAESANETVDALAKLYGFKAPADPDPGEKTRTGTAPGLTGGKSDALAQAREEWAERAAASTEGKDTLLTIEMDFWSEKMETVDRSTKEGKKLYDHYHALLLAAIRKYNADAKAESRVEIEIQREGALDALDVAKAEIEEKRTLRDLDAVDAQRQLRAIADQSYQIKQAALEEELALAEGDLVKQAGIRKQLAALDRAHHKELAAIDKSTTAEITKNWDAVFGHLTTAMRTSFQGVMQGTETLRDAWRNLWRNMTLDFIASEAERLKHKAAVALAERGINTQTALHRVATESWAVIQSVALNAWAAIKNIASYAAQAAAATWAAISAIPIVGPFLAPAIAAGATVAVLSFAGSVASAAGGYDIPAGVNPMTQLHAQEMVLPADIANSIRASVGGGAGGGQPIAVHIHATDAESVQRLFLSHRDALGAALAQAITDNHSGLNRALRNRG